MTKPASAPPAALLPCPFCGNPNVTDDEGCFPLNHARSRWEVRCGNPSCYAHEQQAATREEAIAKWNRRAASAQVREVEASGIVWSELNESMGHYGKPAPEPVPVAQGDMTDRLEGLARALQRRGYPDNAKLIREAIADHARIVAELEARIERLSVEATNWYRAHTQAEASLAACRADAERYRWLRVNDNADLLAEDVIDDAIDAIKEPGNG
jgi:hypothetical protein